MALERFIPKSPDPFIRNSQDFEVAKFGHLNTIVEYINNNSAKPAGLNGYVQFNNNSALGGDAGLFWDNVNKRLGVGTVTPGAVLEIYGGTETLGISGPANQAKSIQIARYNNSSFQSHYIGDDGGAFFGAGLTISASGSNSQLYLQVASAGRNVNIGSAGQTLLPKDLGARLGVRGSGSTSATTSLLTQSSTGTTTFSVGDDGNILVGASTITFGSNIYFNRITSNFGGVTYDNDGVGSVRASYTNGRYSTNDRVGFGAYNNALSRVLIVGTGSTSATTSLLVQNSGGNNTLQVLDDASVVIQGNNTSSTQLFRVNNSTGNYAIRTTNSYSTSFGYFGAGDTVTVLDGSVSSAFRAGLPLISPSWYAAYFSCVSGDVRVGQSTSGTNANPSAILQCNTTTQGFLPPRMTTAEKNAISSPVAGLVVFDTTLNKLCVYTTAWQTITSV